MFLTQFFCYSFSAIHWLAHILAIPSIELFSFILARLHLYFCSFHWYWVTVWPFCKSHFQWFFQFFSSHLMLPIIIWAFFSSTLCWELCQIEKETTHIIFQIWIRLCCLWVHVYSAFCLVFFSPHDHGSTKSSLLKPFNFAKGQQET